MEDNLSIRITDCTLRDGGYVNNHNFTQTQVIHSLNNLLVSGVDLIEIGYFRRDGKPVGLTACCPDSLLELLPRDHKNKLAVMIQPNIVRTADIASLQGSAINYVRIPTRLDNMCAGIALANAAREAKLKVCFNIIRASELKHDVLQSILHEINVLNPDILYFADSNGAMLPFQVERLIRFATQQCDIPIGFHAHDNLNLALANSIAALNSGARWVDSTIGGLGKGGGNAATEVLLPLVAYLTGRKVQLSKLLDAIVVYPDGLFPPRMRERIESVIFGLHNFNIDNISNFKAEVVKDAKDIDRLYQTLSSNQSACVTSASWQHCLSGFV